MYVIYNVKNGAYYSNDNNQKITWVSNIVKIPNIALHFSNVLDCIEYINALKRQYPNNKLVLIPVFIHENMKTLISFYQRYRGKKAYEDIAPNEAQKDNQKGE